MTEAELKGEVAIVKFAHGSGFILPFDDAVTMFKLFNKALKHETRWDSDRHTTRHYIGGDIGEIFLGCLSQEQLVEGLANGEFQYKKAEF